MLGRCFKQSKMSNALSIVELLVHMDCEGCEKRIRRAIAKLNGVDTLEIDMDKQKVTVKGYVDQRRVLKIVRRTGRKAEFWPYPYHDEYYPYASQYFDESNFTSSYNYYMHGHNESIHGYLPTGLPNSTVIEDEVADLFSVENVHACSIM
ncbi:heavy metal-associated isoprenylated plant protein 45 [Daucus carota subsp. sativus]|nr:PREDICTED: heavy metal-associated isoprenylated plant protein 21 [Daucus carota subsp. sativus]